MAHIHIKRGSLSENDYYNRMDTTSHLQKASKDINYWSFEVQPKPAWAARTTDHVFMAKDKKTGIENPWLIDEASADEDGSFEKEHNRIREAFTAVLLELEHLMKKLGNKP